MDDPTPRVQPPEEFFAEYAESIENRIWADAEQQLRAEHDVIVDAGFWSRKSRDVVRDRLDRIGAEAKVYFVTCPRSVMLARALERNRKQSRDTLWIDEPAFEKLIRSFERMQPDEDFVLIDGTA